MVQIRTANQLIGKVKASVVHTVALYIQLWVLYALDTIRYSTQYAQLFKYVAYSHTLDICKRNLYPHHLRLNSGSASHIIINQKHNDSSYIIIKLLQLLSLMSRFIIFRNAIIQKSTITKETTLRDVYM